MESVWEENEHESARLALAKMAEELPNDFSASTFLGIPFKRLTREELYVVIRYTSDTDNIMGGISQMEHDIKRRRGELLRRSLKPWWRFWE